MFKYQVISSNKCSHRLLSVLFVPLGTSCCEISVEKNPILAPGRSSSTRRTYFLCW